MKKIKILKNFIDNNNGILLTTDVDNMNIHRQYIKILCDENYIQKVARGIYVKNGKSINEIFLLQQRYKKGIFSHNTALYLYNLTDRAPLKYDITFESKTRIHDKSIAAHYIKQELFLVGVNTVDMEDGTTVNCYDIDRTIIDMIRNRNKIDGQIFNTAIKEYMKRKDKNLINLAKYAKLFNVQNILKQYMEVL